MQINGVAANCGYSVAELENIRINLTPFFECFHADLATLLPIEASASSSCFPPASILIIRNWLQNLPAALQEPKKDWENELW
jgi:hypothetical protein